MSEYLLIENLILIILSVFIGGIVKGSVGIGMSMFSVPIIAFILPPTKAMMLLCFPVIFTNFLQMDYKKGSRQFQIFTDVSSSFFRIVNWWKINFEFKFELYINFYCRCNYYIYFIKFFWNQFKNLKKANEKILSVIIGFFSGILGGLTTFYAPPIITFLISINLDKEFLLNSISISPNDF